MILNVNKNISSLSHHILFIIKLKLKEIRKILVNLNENSKDSKSVYLCHIILKFKNKIFYIILFPENKSFWLI